MFYITNDKINKTIVFLGLDSKKLDEEAREIGIYEENYLDRLKSGYLERKYKGGMHEIIVLVENAEELYDKLKDIDCGTSGGWNAAAKLIVETSKMLNKKISFAVEDGQHRVDSPKPTC